MDNKAWNEAERRRVDKFREIMRLVSTTLGPDADLEQETKHAIEQWEETVEMDIDPLAPTNALQALLREYHNICDEILKIEDEQIGRRDEHAKRKKSGDRRR